MKREKKPLITVPTSVELLAHTMTLDELLTGARQGMRAHVGELQRRFGPDLLRRVELEDSTVTADAVVSDFFMKLPEALDGYEDRGKFETWLWVIAKNLLLDKRRRRKRLPAQLPDSGFDVAGGASPRHSFERNDLVEKLSAPLPPRQREVWLRHLQGYSDQDTARELGIKPNNAAQLLFRAKARVRARALEMGLRPDYLADTWMSEAELF